MANVCTAVLFWAALIIQPTNALQWTSSVDLPDNSTVTACVGDNVTLAWNYQTDAAEHVLDVEWLFQPRGESEEMLATFIRGNFLVTPTTSQNVQFVSSAGLRMLHVTTQDSGTYTVNVVLNIHGSVVVEAQTVLLEVADARTQDSPAATDGSLHVTLLSRATQNNVTGQWHAQLACGAFSRLGQPAASVVWTTPSNDSLASTYYDSGSYVLVVDNPVVSGEYTCQLLHTPSSMCLSPDSPLLHAAALNVTEIDAQFAVLEGRLWLLQSENEMLRSEYTNATSVLEGKLRAVETENAQLRTELLGQGQDISHLNTVIEESLLTKYSELQNELTSIRQQNSNTTASLEAQIQKAKAENTLLRNELNSLKAQNENYTAVLESRLHTLQAELETQHENNINATAEMEAKLQAARTELEQENSHLRSELESERAQNAILTSQIAGLSGVLQSTPVQDLLHQPASCEDVRQYDTNSGVHTVYLNNAGTFVKVFCDQTTDEGGWTVIQRRYSGSVDFYRDWKQYEAGFGDITQEFWLGLSKIYRLTNSGLNYSLRVDLEDWDGSTAYAVYDSFCLQEPYQNYRIRISGYNGTAGDGLTLHNINNYAFTTNDRDNDGRGSGNCAELNRGAWWYNNCGDSNLNGRYFTDFGVRREDGMHWFPWKNDYRSLKRVEIKIRPRD